MEVSNLESSEKFEENGYSNLLEEENNDSNHNAEGEEEEEEEEEESTYREPISDGRNLTFETRILNQHLVCSLCMGYIKDAHTIIECLHTFCKSCIAKYLKDKAECPQCDVVLGPYPMEKIKFDRQIQNIVDKVLPQLAEKDAEEERQFYISKGISVANLPELNKEKRPAESTENENRTVKKLKKEELKKQFYSDEVGFELILDESETNLKALDKPFIRTSAKVTVKHLKKYLISKLKLDSNSVKDLQITYRGELLGNEHTLEYILKSRGWIDSSKNPIFKYSMEKDPV
eukprot:TRINITY_DN167_c0_g1_i1.p1 TRINITY_DN167_c0_g1~~TRINITY_DN167_c0_g1_i1.p1  ORF type:complete len:289 (+),score=93.65 TRINITY_DN167_c0_g1_i1:68-934(+)